MIVSFQGNVGPKNKNTGIVSSATIEILTKEANNFSTREVGFILQNSYQW